MKAIVLLFSPLAVLTWTAGYAQEILSAPRANLHTLRVSPLVQTDPMNEPVSPNPPLRESVRQVPPGTSGGWQPYRLNDAQRQALREQLRGDSSVNPGARRP